MVEVREVMGTVVSVDVRDGAATAAAAAARAAFAWLDEVDLTFSTYRDASDVCRLDRGEISLAECSDEVADVLDRCEELRAETGGAFDVRATGSLDPSALVKGWAVERAAQLLEGFGLRRYCVNAGGDVRVGLGPAPGQSWRVGIRHPRAADQVAAVVGARRLAVATSGAYERGPHVIDPRTGLPPSGVLSTTVVGEDLGTADAYATAAFAMGRHGIAWVAGLTGYAGMAIHDDGTVVVTPGFDALREPAW
ncbi:MAG TPA: FAD:protein FMN transferase [Baekduia sp.]|uniref:FAD:protein FMN transferase n=1 Tax=Baekduia sp. TaxID=2600305 RepID=UPI002D0C3C3C|nr:FAD:protein FMN transferase [Baekduia sp.]HMJ37780.1 FAD:protein FMN transferase [Baekduia sp.]